jgi:hypothetical protein
LRAVFDVEATQPAICGELSVRLVQQTECKSAAISGAGLSEINPRSAHVGGGLDGNPNASCTCAPGVDIPVPVVAKALWPDGGQGGRVIERPDLAVSVQEINELMGFDTIMIMEQRHFTATQRAPKYGAAR